MDLAPVANTRNFSRAFPLSSSATQTNAFLITRWDSPCLAAVWLLSSCRWHTDNNVTIFMYSYNVTYKM